ncbi:SusC/RagA family TonB-linked outer membrane protein [Chryseobacterium mucoviscidosis]|uniref:SusC/RagA family TonB-linked outer membrane protein n=1 Tax=Chryseobacterium mucoviscidosis TaxID=1945581 RepID=UPI0031DEF703
MLKFINIFAFVKILKTVNMNVKLKVLTIGAIFFLGEVVSAQQKRKDTISTKEIEEVVVVAYGKQKKETVIGSNVQIGSDNFKDRPVTNVANAIDGAAPGIQVSAGSGQPGSLPAIRIRGFSSISAGNNPLYVVDGVIYNGSVSAINSLDVESINVLKDAASTSLYGSSAANGVILITTKKGRKGRDVVNFSLQTGISQRGVPEYDRVGISDYYLLNWEALRNGRLTTGASATTALANTWASDNLIANLGVNVYKNVANNAVVVNGVVASDQTLKYNDLDWSKPLFKTGLRQSYDLSYAGGGEKTTYFASLGYLNDQGYLVKSGLERFTARLNVESQLRSWVKVGINLAATNTKTENSYNGADNNTAIINPYRFSRSIGPIYSPYVHNADGSNVFDSNGDKVYEWQSTRGANASTGRNAIYERMLNSDITRANNITSRVFADFKLLKDLKLSIIGGYDLRNAYNREYQNNILGDAAPAGAASRTNENTYSVNFIQLLNYTKKLGSHNIDLLVGHENNKYTFEYFYGYKQGQVGENNDDLANFITPTSLTSYTDTYNKEAFFARANYDFNEKYLLSGSIRRDASSRFAPDKRWNTFWSAGAGWRVNKESFMDNFKFIDEFKLRSSYGEVGNDQGIGFYAYQTLFEYNNNAGLPGVVFGTQADPNITWESNNQFDIGLDFAFLNRRIRGSVEWYKRETDGLLFNVPVPMSSGVPNTNVFRNVGAMYNKGIEASLTLGIINGEKGGWDLTINASTLKNQISKMPNGQPEIISGSKKLMEGRSIYDYWLRQWYGVDPSNGDGLFLLDPTLTPVTGQDKQINGVWVTNRAARAKYDFADSAIPDVFGSINNEFRYKNFTLSALVTYQIGGKINDTNYALIMTGYPQGRALHADALNRWQNPGDVTDVPRFDSSLASQYDVASTRWLVDASFINLRNVTLGYKFSEDVTKTLGFSRLDMFISGENLYIKTKRKGLEPQENFSGETTNRFTPARIFSFGLNASF